jgi:hypothetical protein
VKAVVTTPDTSASSNVSSVASPVAGFSSK